MRWLLALAFVLSIASVASAAEIKVGSKRFTESYILAEITVALAKKGGDATVTHQQGLGGTALVYRALEEGSIDVYPEYTGTIVEAILHRDGPADLAAIRDALDAQGILVSDPIGFENKYALAVKASFAEKNKLVTISDLARMPSARVGLSHEFMGRSDGWPGLRDRYGLHPASVEGLDHGLAYEALQRGAIDALDVYSTDASIVRYGLQVLGDDRHFFPPYQAVLLFRKDLPARAPKAWASVLTMIGAIDAEKMTAMNAKAEIDKVSFASIGEGFASGDGDRHPAAKRTLLGETLKVVVTEGPRHLWLVALALALSILAGVPLGIVAARSRRAGTAIVSTASVVQTIPSLALLCFLIPLLGTGPLPALVALFLYGLLPIVRNTVAGFQNIPPALVESAEALGLSARAQLFQIKLPLASRTILAGIKTSAVINVGTATLAAFIGAGGFGAPISVGLNLNDTTLILAGAIPAALLALGAEGGFALLDRALIPRGLRLAEAAR